MWKSAICIWIPLIGLLLSCAPTKEQGSAPPNILFILTDDHASPAISAYGSTLITTPQIDRIARDGILYSNAFVTNSICAPSRAVILTGKYSHVNGLMDNHQVFDAGQPTFPGLLREHGYQTAIVGKWHLKSAPQGFDYWNVLPGQGDYYNPQFIKGGKDTVYQGYVTDIITDLSLEWLEGRDRDKPFCMLLQHKAPHRNWMPAPRHLELFDDSEFLLPENFYDDYRGREGLKKQLLTVKDHMDMRLDYKVPCDTCGTHPVNDWAPGAYHERMSRLTSAEKELWNKNYEKETREFLQVHGDDKAYDRWKFRRYMEDYLRCIAAVDEGVGKVLDYLEESGLDKNTVVVYTSDQGFFFGEHGLFDKRFMYEEALKTPLIVRYPGEIGGGTRSDLMVQNLDIAPTILDMAGIPVPEEMQGVSLRPTWQGDPVDWRDAVYYHYYEKGWGALPHYGIRTERYKLIHFYDELDWWELYDLQEDPAEMNNLYYGGTRDELADHLKKRLVEQQQKFGEISFQP